MPGFQPQKQPQKQILKPALKRPETFADRLEKRFNAMRANPKRTAVRVVMVLVVMGLACQTWGYRASETWIVAPEDVQLKMGVKQQVSVSLQYRAPFMWPIGAWSIPATISMVPNGERIRVDPTTQVTKSGTPAAVFTVTGEKLGRDELIIAASPTPRVPDSWRTASTKAVVVK